MRHSLRARLSLSIAVCIVLAGLLAGVLSFAVAYAEAVELQDGQLRQLAALASAGQLAPGPAVVPRAGIGAENPLVIQSLADAAGPLGPLPPTLADGLHTLSVRGTPWRLAVHTFASGPRMAAAQPTSVRDEIALDGALHSTIPLLVLLPLLAGLVSVVVRVTLAPVGGLAAQLDGRSAGDLTLLDASAVPDEIAPFADSINNLLARVRSLLAQQERFIADAAHELRTPITALLLQAENLERVLPTAETRERLAPLQAGLARTRALLEQLLALAQQQAGEPAPRRMRLDEAVAGVVEDLAPLARSRGVQVRVHPFEAAEVDAGEGQLAAIARNAIDNALRYSAPGGTVEVRVAREAGCAVLQVEDRGSGVPEAERRRVFEPFYRVPGSAETGSGLGLAIVQAVADRLGGTVELAARAGGGSCFRYRQPLAG
ncbi:MAG: sensor histidine kinase [Ramlibacter sp.]|nr:sensor histidine kinase [Ramlibacter sp.]